MLNSIKIWLKKLSRKYPSTIDLITTHLTLDEKQCLFSLSNKFMSNAKIAVEVGSYLGASSCCIAHGMSKDCLLYCVDTWNNDAMSEGLRDTYAEFIANVSAYPCIVPLRGKSTDIADSFMKPVHFLFLDGDHSYEAIKADVDAWLPKLAPNALVACHDVGWAQGVQRVVEEDILPLTKRSQRLPNLFWAILR